MLFVLIYFLFFSEEWKEHEISNYLEVRDTQQVPTEDAPLMAFVAGVGIVDKGERYDRSFLVKDDAKKYKRKVKHLWFIILLFILLFISIIAIFRYNILWLYYEKKYEIKHNNRYLVEEALSYDKENKLVEENSVHVNDFKVVLSDLEYTENKLNFNLKFLHSKPLNHAGYILRVFNEDYCLGDRFNGQISLDSATEWLISMDKFYEENFHFDDVEKNVEKRMIGFDQNDYMLLKGNITKYGEILEDGSLIHKISLEIPEEFVIDDVLNIDLFDINYQNIGNPEFYQVKAPLSEIKYTIDFTTPDTPQNN